MVVYLSEGTDPLERADALQIAACGEQSQSVHNIHYGSGSTMKEAGSDYIALLPSREMVGRHELMLEDITHIQLRVLGIRPAGKLADVNRTIEFSARLVDQFQQRTDVVAELAASETLRWRSGGRETVNVAYDITVAAKDHILRPTTILQLETEEPISWARMSIAIFSNVSMSAR